MFKITQCDISVDNYRVLLIIITVKTCGLRWIKLKPYSIEHAPGVFHNKLVQSSYTFNVFLKEILQLCLVGHIIYIYMLLHSLSDLAKRQYMGVM